MRHIQKKISLEQFTSRMPSIISAYDEKGIFNSFDLMSYPYSNYGMTPVDIKWKYGLYSGQFLSYSTISSWYHFFITYYNGLKIDNKCTNKNYSSYVEYLENDNSCPYSRESCLILDTKCDEIGGLEAYSFMCDVLFPRYIIKDEDLISYWQTDTLYINDILKWIAWFDDRVHYSFVSDCSLSQEKCCDCEEYKNRGGNQMSTSLKLFINTLQTKIDSIEIRNESSDTDCTTFTIPLFLSNSIDNMGEYSILSEEWEGGEDFGNKINGGYGTVVSYNGNDWLVNGSSIGYKYSDTYKEYYFGNENGMTDYELTLYNDGNNIISKGSNDNQYVKYIDFYRESHPEEFEAKLGDNVSNYSYTNSGLLVINPTNLSMATQYPLIQSEKGYFIVNDNVCQVFETEYITYKNMNYEVKYDVTNNPYCIINNRKKFGLFNEALNAFEIEGKLINSPKEFVYVNDVMFEVVDNTIQVKNTVYPKISAYSIVGDKIVKFDNNHKMVTYQRDENVLSLVENSIDFYRGWEVDINANIFYAYNDYITYDIDKITGITESKLSSLLSDDIIMYDAIGHKLPGLLVKDMSGKYIEPKEGEWLDIYYQPMNMSHLSKDGDNYWGNVISSLSFYYEDRGGNKIVETETIYSLDGIYQSSLEAISDCKLKKDNLLEKSYFATTYGMIGDLKCDIIYHMGAVFNNSSIIDKGIKYIDTVTLIESQCYYYTTDTYCYGINYYDLRWDVINYDDSVHNNKELSVFKSKFEYDVTDWTKDNDFTAFPLIREEYKLGTSSLENVKSDIYIDRGTARALDTHLKLMEIHSMESLENYGNSSFNIIGN